MCIRDRNKPTPNQTSDTSIAAVPVAAPYGADECLEQDYMTIQDAFYAAGFMNIEAEKVEDLQAADVDKVNTIDAISVDGKTDFTKEQVFQSDDEVLIRYHGYAKCNVKIHVDFVPNLIFSKYDVNLLLNGIEEGTLTHGEDQDFELSIDPGEYTLTFESAESSSVKGEDVYKRQAYVNAIPAVEKLTAKLSGDEKTGAQIIAKALQAPIRQIAENAGVDGSIVFDKIRSSRKVGYGYNAYTETYCDMVPSGIVDPTKVTRSALENAVSISACVLTTESLVADKPDPQADAAMAAAAQGGGMGGMY